MALTHKDPCWFQRSSRRSSRQCNGNRTRSAYQSKRHRSCMDWSCSHLSWHRSSSHATRPDKRTHTNLLSRHKPRCSDRGLRRTHRYLSTRCCCRCLCWSRRLDTQTRTCMCTVWPWSRLRHGCMSLLRHRSCDQGTRPRLYTSQRSECPRCNC